MAAAGEAAVVKNEPEGEPQKVEELSVEDAAARTARNHDGKHGLGH